MWACVVVPVTVMRPRFHSHSFFLGSLGTFPWLGHPHSKAEHSVSKPLGTPLCMRVLLTVATISGAISASAALLPVVASDFLSLDGAEPIDPLDLVIEPPAPELQATLSSGEVKSVVAPPAAELPKPKLKVVSEVVKVITGEASWYGPGFYGNRTANGLSLIHI